MSQIHNEFKLFTHPYTSVASITELADKVEAWVKSASVAPKSVGIEYLEGTKAVLLSLGYTRQEPHAVKLIAESIGKIDVGGDLSAIEKKMGSFADHHKNVICHELIVTENNDLVTLLMVKA